MQLLKLAAEGQGARAKLLQELSEILIDWPDEYAPDARGPFEALLEKTLRAADAATRASVAAAIARRSDAPVGLLNQLFFAASAETRDRIVARNDAPPERASGSADFDEDALIAAARRSSDAFRSHFSSGVGLSGDIATEVLSDESAQSLAIVLKGAHARRSTFSALAVIVSRACPVEASYARLASYDGVPLGAAERMLACWRSREWPNRASSRNAAE